MRRHRTSSSPEVVTYRSLFGTDEYGGLITYDLGVAPTDGVYTDRLNQWDYQKSRELKLRHFGNEGDYWSGRSRESIQAFLCEYLGKSVMLCKITDYTNQSSGYPVWRLDFIYNQ